MADLKKWFKVWSTILIDEVFVELSDELLGKWTRLGARIASIGKDGTTRFKNWESLVKFLKVNDINEAKKVLNRLPNVYFEEGKNDNGEITVTYKKWRKYQLDSAGYQRLKKHREKENDNDLREEKRREEKTKKREEKKFKYKTLNDALNDKEFKEELLKINLVDWDVEVKKMKAWIINNPSKKNWKRFVSGWIGRVEKKKEEIKPPYHKKIDLDKLRGE